MIKNACIVSSLSFSALFASAQSKTTANPVVEKPIPVSHADLGAFPYFKTWTGFRPLNESDSLIVEQNTVYFFDGKKVFTVDGKVCSEKLTLYSDDSKTPSDIQIIQDFDKIVNALGGKKIFTGEIPETLLKSASGKDVVSLSSNHQLVNSGYYGVVEYVIKTPEKEVWVQLQPYSIKSKFFSLLVVEKQTKLITTNINKQNLILQDLEKNKQSVVYLQFAPDSATLQTQSGDELLNIAGVFQKHPDWKLKIEVHNAPVGKPEYTLSLTQQRAAAIKQQLTELGVKSAAVDAQGLGDQKPLVSNDTEKGRITNSRVVIVRL
jgi:OmpA-OmpF porin, OOP family